MLNLVKTYMIYILLAFIIILIATIIYLYFAKITAESELKSSKQSVLELKKEIKLLEINTNVRVANAEIRADANQTIEEINILKEMDLNETYDYVNSSADIFGGMYFKSN